LLYIVARVSSGIGKPASGRDDSVKPARRGGLAMVVGHRDHEHTCDLALAADRKPAEVLATTTPSLIDDELFLDLMGALAGGVTVVTAIDGDGKPWGLTSTAVTSVSRRPPLLLVCIDMRSRTLTAIRSAGRFAVNFLGSAHSNIAMHFASKAEDKFASLGWLTEATGAPILHDYAHAWADCYVDREIEVGDHVLVIGAVVHGGISGRDDERPLAYHRRVFGHFVAQDATSTPR
jgi:flavin reductase (NADH)